MNKNVRLTIHKEEFSFSAGHFTIFSQEEREHLHGHNYTISLTLHMLIPDLGLACDYRVYKKKLATLCEQLDRKFLLPLHCKYLKLHDDVEYIIAEFNQQRIPFLKDDVILLPISNTTIEEISHWFLQNLITNKEELNLHGITAVQVAVYNGPGQSAEASWNV